MSSSWTQVHPNQIYYLTQIKFLDKNLDSVGCATLCSKSEVILMYLLLSNHNFFFYISFSFSFLSSSRSLYYIKTCWKRMFLYKWPLYDLFWPFFAICMFIFLKTEVLTVILRCLTGLTYDLIKSYDTKHKYFHFFCCHFLQKQTFASFAFFAFLCFFAITFVPIKI